VRERDGETDRGSRDRERNGGSETEGRIKKANVVRVFSVRSSGESTGIQDFPFENSSRRAGGSIAFTHRCPCRYDCCSAFSASFFSLFRLFRYFVQSVSHRARRAYESNVYRSDTKNERGKPQNRKKGDKTVASGASGSEAEALKLASLENFGRSFLGIKCQLSFMFHPFCS